MTAITASVGHHGANRREDVARVQRLLNRFPLSQGVVPLKVDGLCGRKTIERIRAFQAEVVMLSRPDGRVDPGGHTLAALNAGSGPARQWPFSDDGLDILKAIEQLRLGPYDDQTGDPISEWVPGATIGYGHLIAHDEWDAYRSPITEAAAETLLRHDLDPFVQAVRLKVKTDLTQNEFDALVIFVFNIGVAGFSGSSVLKLLNNPLVHTNYDSLEDAWKAWNKSQGRVMQGLVNRRNAEWDIFARDVYATW